MSVMLKKSREIAAKAAETARSVADTAKEKAADGAEALVERAGETKDRMDKARFSPVYDLEEIDNNKPRVIHIADNPRMRNSPICKGAIGFKEKIKGMQMIGLLPENISLQGIKFYPNTNGILYYRDPCNDHIYIDLDDYFDYLNEVRVNEIKNVAHDLGAKHIKVVYKEEKKSLFSVKAKAQAAAKNKGILKPNAEGEAEADHNKKQNVYSNIEVLAEVDYDGSDEPTMPTLIYLKNNPMINSLIKRRMDGDRSIKKETYTIKCKTLQGLQQEDIAKLDGVLKQLKIGGNASVSSESEAENRAILELIIDF